MNERENKQTNKLFLYFIDELVYRGMQRDSSHQPSNVLMRVAAKPDKATLRSIVDLIASFILILINFYLI